ncbi:MAG: sugar ABC transporter permease [Anaerolineaceae bacterium]|nr:MAG: sugar ABC transporter permease [Anaerolineaceae bacterium]
MLMNKHLRTIFHVLAVALVIAVAFGLRTRAAEKLPIDYDEDDYLRAGQEFAHLIRTSDWRGFLDTNYRPEHPPLAKIAYGLAFLHLPERALVSDVAITDSPAQYLPPDQLHAARTEASIFGALTAGLVALVNPLGGLMLAIHSFTIKYTSQVMLDGLSALLSLGTVMAYVQYKKKQRTGWMITSAVLLGLTADSKFLHGTIGFAILLDWFFLAKNNKDVKRFFKSALFWGLLSIAVFFAANPFLWPNPIERLQVTLDAVRVTTTNSNVANAGYVAWQQLNWLTMSVPWPQNGAFIFLADTFIALLAVIGFGRLWKKERVFGIWILLEIFILLVWRTKWPQYILIVTAPLALAAGEGILTLWQPVVEWWKKRGSAVPARGPERSEERRALPWLIPGLVAFALLTLIPLVFQFAISLTDFNSSSLRDGLNGGIWRAVWEGLTGQARASGFDISARSNQVNFTGLNTFSPVFQYISGRADGWSILYFNVMWTVLTVLLQCGLGLGAALLLWQKGVRLGKFWQALFILPWAIPELIGAQMWLNIFHGDWGWLRLAAEKFGADSIFGFVSSALHASPSLWLLEFLLPAIWYGFPFMMLAASAGLKTIPQEALDAAAMDGANAWQTFRAIVWPLLTPLIIPALIVRGIFSFNQFYLFQTYYFQDATLATLSYNVFNPNSGYSNVSGGYFAVSAVINILTVVILMIFVTLFNRWSRAGEGVTYA